MLINANDKIIPMMYTSSIVWSFISTIQKMLGAAKKPQKRLKTMAPWPFPDHFATKKA